MMILVYDLFVVVMVFNSVGIKLLIVLEKVIIFF